MFTYGKVTVLLLALLCLVAYSRLVSILGLDVHQYPYFLGGYFSTGARALVFLIQFLGVAYFFKEIFAQRTRPVRYLTTAAVFLSLVSIARFNWPIFIISVCGDFLVIWWFRHTTEETIDELP
jgi:hypothetical protein